MSAFFSKQPSASWLRSIRRSVLVAYFSFCPEARLFYPVMLESQSIDAGCWLLIQYQHLNYSWPVALCLLYDCVRREVLMHNHIQCYFSA